MADQATPIRPAITPRHRNLLAAAAAFSVALIAMGGVLCVTHSIRSCPDWPGCYGKILPPLETSPILEVTHRLLAAITGVLVLSAAIAGIRRARGLPWILVPPLVAMVLVLVVSMFGALVVLQGLPPGWAAVDVASALMVVALMVAAAVVAFSQRDQPARRIRLAFHGPLARLALATGLLVYAVFVSGVLVAGSDSITGCLGWPIYSPSLSQSDLPGAGKSLRLALSVVGISMILALLAQAWFQREQRPATYRAGRWTAAAFLVEAVVQMLILVFGPTVYLLVPYTVTASVFWALLVATVISAGLEGQAAD